MMVRQTISSHTRYFRACRILHRTLFLALLAELISWDLTSDITADMVSTIPPIAKLPLPAEDDSVETLDIKLSSYLYVVHTGNSIAAATGSVHGESKRNQPETRAIDGMRPHEREYYEAWRERSPLALPCIDWNKDQGRMPTSQRPLKKANRCAEALNRIYSTDKAEPCHYTYFVEYHPLWVPLVTAVARVIGAERHQKETSMKSRARSHDFQVVQKIIQTSLRVISRAEENSVKTGALEKIQLLQSSLRSKEQARDSSLGKRKSTEELSVSGEDLQTANHLRTSILDGDGLSRIESSLAQRPKRS